VLGVGGVEVRVYGDVDVGAGLRGWGGVRRDGDMKLYIISMMLMFWSSSLSFHGLFLI